MKKLILTISVIFFFAMLIQAQEGDNDKKNEKKEKISIKIKDGAETIIYIDGREYDKDIIELIDKDKIKSIKVIKGDSARSFYKSPSVIIISTEENDKFDVYKYDMKKDHVYTYNINVDSIRKVNMPRVIINGEFVKPDSLRKINPDDIIRIDVIKDITVMTKYNTKKGVIIVTTKENGKKSKKKKDVFTIKKDD